MLPKKTIERLSLYRRVLLTSSENGNDYIFSHELASLLHLTSVQVRRDIMLIGYTGTQRKGYKISELIKKINSILNEKEKTNVVIVGMGHLGKAITNYFNSNNSNIQIVAAFDIDPSKTDKIIAGIKSYHINELEKVLKQSNASIAIMALSSKGAQSVADKLVHSGIKGILNFTSVPINVSDDVYIENYDMITSLEKVAYFVKEKK